jgi:phosphoacetylglucosamine mutase
VFFTQQPFSLFDGDKMACLICDFLQNELSYLTIDLNWGVVQTAYANGASTAFLQRTLGPDRVCLAKTGVKYVHHAACQFRHFGVYFEANGHGTIVFQEAFQQALDAVEPSTPRSALALQRLRLVSKLVHPTVGDSIADLLLIDAILKLNYTVEAWDSMYTDLPSRQIKVACDRTQIRTNDTETICLEPPFIQKDLDEAMKECRGSRAFIRPSGTEDVVRVYAEAPTQEQADALAQRASEIIQRHVPMSKI